MSVVVDLFGESDTDTQDNYPLDEKQALSLQWSDDEKECVILLMLSPLK